MEEVVWLVGSLNFNTSSTAHGHLRMEKGRIIVSYLGLGF